MPPPQYKIYLLYQTKIAELKMQIIDLLEENKIWVSDSPYGATILFAKKKDRQLYLCINYCALNKNTISDSYPLPHIEKATLPVKRCTILFTFRS